MTRHKDERRAHLNSNIKVDIYDMCKGGAVLGFELVDFIVSFL